LLDEQVGRSTIFNSLVLALSMTGGISRARSLQSIRMRIVQPGDRVMNAPISGHGHGRSRISKALDGLLRFRRINGLHFSARLISRSSTSARTTLLKSSSTACLVNSKHRRAARTIHRYRVQVGSGLGDRRHRRSKEHTFSERLACPDCGISVPQLEPRSFSLIRPYGASLRATVSVPKYDFDPSKIITDWTVRSSMAAHRPGPGSQFSTHLCAGGLRTWLRPRNPFEKFPARIQNSFCTATRRPTSLWRERISRERNPNDKGFRFPGILKFLERISKSPTPIPNREWITQYCPPRSAAFATASACAPNRWRSKARRLVHRRFHRAPRSAPGDAVTKFSRSSPSARKEIAARPLEEVSERIDFLLAVGLAISAWDRSAATLPGGEAQRNPPRHANRLAPSRRSLRSRRAQHRPPTPATTPAFSALSNSFAISAIPCRRRARRRPHPPG